jgi:hypothetical protein
MPASTPLPDRVRVILLDQRQVLVDQPRIVGDSLRGLREVPPAVKRGLLFNPTSQETCAVALGDIRRIEEHKMDLGKTAVLLFTLGGFAAMIAIAADDLY